MSFRGGRSPTWENGRQLTQITTGGKTTDYAYDADGIRTTKIVNGTKHEYLTLNGKIVYEKIGDGDTAKVMIFSYDAQGRPFAVKYSKNNGAKFTNYFYALNQQGDVVKIFRPEAVKDADGNVTGYTEKTYATYTYDAWGKLIGITNSAGTSIINKQTTSTSLANLNPLRYRGYYYDNETGFYYLQSRYYDPAVRRFISSDGYVSTGQGIAGTNMFVYCGNTPTSRADDSGEGWVSALVGGVVGAIVGAVSAVVTGGDWTDAIIGAVSGAAGGAVIGATGNLDAGVKTWRVVGSACNAVGTYISTRRNGGDVGDALLCAGVSFVTTYAVSSIPCGGDPLTEGLVSGYFGGGASLCTNALSAALTKDKPKSEASRLEQNSSVFTPTQQKSKTTSLTGNFRNSRGGGNAHQTVMAY